MGGSEPANGSTASVGATDVDRLRRLLRHHRLAVRTIAVTYRAAHARLRGDVVDLELVARWRQWALDALAEYEREVQAALRATAGELSGDAPADEVAAFEAELAAAVDSVRDR